MNDELNSLWPTVPWGLYWQG